MEQLNLTVNEVDGSVWLSYQFQLYENEILVGVTQYALGIIF
jgi:hypothetical protein